MVRVSIDGQPLTATAALVWNGDLPRPLQQILFDTADGLTPPPASSVPAAAWPGQQSAAALVSGRTPPSPTAGTSPAGLHPAAECGCPIQAHIASILEMITVSNRGAEWLICARTQAHSYLHGLAKYSALYG